MKLIKFICVKIASKMANEIVENPHYMNVPIGTSSYTVCRNSTQNYLKKKNTF